MDQKLLKRERKKLKMNEVRPDSSHLTYSGNRNGTEFCTIMKRRLAVPVRDSNICVRFDKNL